MKREVVQFAFVIIAIVIAAAAEELLPAFSGVGFPLLLAVAMVMSSRLSVLACVMMAIGAGAFEDALSSLPPMTSICLFTVVALVSHRDLIPRPFMIAIFPMSELWTALCTGGSMGDVFVRMLVSVPIGAVALGMAVVSVATVSRRAGLDG